MTQVEITHEPHTYRQDRWGVSFFNDLISGQRGDITARERLERHAREVDGVMESRDNHAAGVLTERRVETRTNPNTTTGQGGNFAPPLWLIDQFAGAPRTHRVLAHFMPQLPLPAGVSTVNVPRLTTGTKTAPVPDLGLAVSQDIVDAAVTSDVSTITGQQDVAIQLLDQSPVGAHLDYVLFTDLMADYNQRLEQQLINGQGSGVGQLPGILSLPSSTSSGTGKVNSIVYTSGAPTGSEMFPYFGQAAAAIGKNRLMPPSIWLATTSRWAWVATAEDTSKQPLAFMPITAQRAAPEIVDDDIPVPVALPLGWPLYCDDQIPTTLGVSGTQDVVIACRPQDGLLLESAPSFLVDTNSLSGTMQVRLQLHRNVAALQRQPTGIAVIAGTGTICQSGF